MATTIHVEDVFRISGRNIVLTGNVKSDTLSLYMNLNIEGKSFHVEKIEMHHKFVHEAHEGDNIGIFLSNPDYRLFLKLAGHDVTFTNDGTEVTHIDEEEKLKKGFFRKFK